MLAILRTAAEIASALLYLHSISILHADLAGTSVLLTSSNKDERGFTAKASSLPVVREMRVQYTVFTLTPGGRWVFWQINSEPLALPGVRDSTSTELERRLTTDE